MENDVLIDWNQEVADLTPEQQQRVKALIDELRQTRKGQETEEDKEDETEPPASPYYPAKAYYERADIMQIIAKFPKNKKWTFQDLQNIQYFPYDIRIKIELINRKIYAGKNPKLRHQEILSNALTDVGSFVKKNKLGRTYFTPTALKIDDGTVLKPDILFISVSKYDSIKDDHIETAPELVIEVISRSNYKKLREAKKKQYADFGVQEYWEIHTTKRKIIVETLDETTQEFTVFSEARKTGTIKSKVLEGLEIDIENIFE